MTAAVEAVRAALATVHDPEIRRPITELGMVANLSVDETGLVDLTVLLTIAGCPMRDTLVRDVTAAVRAVPVVRDLRLEFGVMTDEQRGALRDLLRGGPGKEIPFARSDSRTRVYAIASGKGGVGKSTVTVNLAAAMAARGLAVGVVDADVYGFSIPRMLGVTARPTQVGDMILPPVAHGVKVISVGMFVDGNVPVVWRGPMLHRALQQFLADVYWGDLDVLLLDLPPGTGDIAISTAQLIPTAEILVVTTPQAAAAEVAGRPPAQLRHAVPEFPGPKGRHRHAQQPGDIGDGNAPGVPLLAVRAGRDHHAGRSSLRLPTPSRGSSPGSDSDNSPKTPNRRPSSPAVAGSGPGDQAVGVGLGEPGLEGEES